VVDFTSNMQSKAVIINRIISNSFPHKYILVLDIYNCIYIIQNNYTETIISLVVVLFLQYFILGH